MSVTPVTMILFSRGIFLTLIVFSNFQYSLLFLAFFGASASGAINTICKGYLAFFPQNLQHPESYIPSIAKKFGIVLQCNSTFRIGL